MKVKHEDLRGLGYCNRGSRLWFKAHNLSWAEFIKKGLPEEDFIKTNDQLALDMVNAARIRAKNG